MDAATLFSERERPVQAAMRNRVPRCLRPRQLTRADLALPDLINHFTKLCSGSEAGSHVRRIDSCITQLEAQGRSRPCNESNEEEDVS